MKLEHKLFNEKGRNSLRQIINERINKQATNSISLSLVNQPNESANHQVAVSLAYSAFYQYLNYVLVDTKSHKPWFVKNKIYKVLSLSEFNEHMRTTSNWIASKPHSQHYMGLVVILTILNLINKMEKDNGT